MKSVRCELYNNGKTTGIQATFTTKAIVEFINRAMKTDGKTWEWREVIPVVVEQPVM